MGDVAAALLVSALILALFVCVPRGTPLERRVLYGLAAATVALAAFSIFHY